MIAVMRKDPESSESKKIRSEFFVNGQKIAKLRYILRYLFLTTPITLSDDELQAVRSIAIKPKTASATIIQTIIQTQKQLSSDEVLEWFSHVGQLDLPMVTPTIIADDRITDDGMKLEMGLKMLQHFNHCRTIILSVDKSLDSNLSIWDKLFHLILDEINKGSNISDRLATIWATEARNLNKYAKKKSVKSVLLYTKTKHEFYLPDEAQDVFLF